VRDAYGKVAIQMGVRLAISSSEKRSITSWVFVNTSVSFSTFFPALCNISSSYDHIVELIWVSMLREHFSVAFLLHDMILQ